MPNRGGAREQSTAQCHFPIDAEPWPCFARAAIGKSSIAHGRRAEPGRRAGAQCVKTFRNVTLAYAAPRFRPGVDAR